MAAFRKSRGKNNPFCQGTLDSQNRQKFLRHNPLAKPDLILARFWPAVETGHSFIVQHLGGEWQLCGAKRALVRQ